MRFFSVLSVLLVAVLANLAFWYVQNMPVPLEPPPGGKLRSVSFAAFRDGQSPLTGVLPSAAQVEEDLKTVAAQSASVRTYTSQEGLQILPELARKYGVTVTMGAWLSSMPSKNEKEIDSLIDLANRYPDVIKRVIVGNEVLLRGELSAEQLIAYIDRVRGAIKQPVSYADVWEWWMKFPQLSGHVDYVTIHLLPYWEDVPASIDGAMERIDGAYHAIAGKFPGKPILVGETGWPTAGRSRGPAVPGVVEMARFTNGLIRLAQKEGFDYNVIEAFDQNWKQALEGTVGGHWGLYTANRTAKFDVAGPVVADVHWPWLFVAASAIAAGLVLATGGAALPLTSLAMLTTLATVLGSSVVLAADRVWSWAYYPFDVGLGVVLVILEAVLAATITMAASRALAGPRLTMDALRPLRRALGPSAIERLGGGSALALTAVAIVWSMLVVFDGRYRGFPNPHFLVGAFGLTFLGLIRAGRRMPGVPAIAAFSFGSLFRAALPRPAGASVRIEAALAAFLVFGAVATVIAEGFVPMESIIYGQQPFLTALGEVEWTRPNLMALGWAGLQFLLAVPFAATVRSAARNPQTEMD